MSTIDYNVLGQAFDTTWGRSSTPRTSSYSVKFTMLGPDRILASYAAIVNFGSSKKMIEMKRVYADESMSIISAALKSGKARYKELSGSSLTTKEVETVDNLEIIGFNVHTPMRTSYYRRRTIFEIG